MLHTRGPWEAGENPKGVYTNEVVVRPRGEFPHGIWVADCGPSSDKEVWANARLIAAAPDLVEFVQQIFNGIDTGMITIDTPADETLANILSRGRKALSKAIGVI